MAGTRRAQRARGAAVVVSAASPPDLTLPVATLGAVPRRLAGAARPGAPPPRPLWVAAIGTAAGARAPPPGGNRRPSSGWQALGTGMITIDRQDDITVSALTIGATLTPERKAR